MSFTNGWKEVTLGEITELITSGATPTVGKTELYTNEREGIPFFRIQNIGVDHLVLSDLKYVTVEVHTGYLKRSKIRSGDVLMTITGRLGTSAVAPTEIKEANINQHICLIRLKEKIADPHYVAFHLNSKETHREIMRKQHGTTRIALNHRTVGSLTINLPPIDIQRKIASCLERTCKLLDIREQANQLTNKLTQSVFLKMFGNSSKWEHVSIGNVCNVMDVDHKMPKSQANGVPFISAKDLVKGINIDFSETKFISEEDYFRLSKKCSPQKNDVLFSRIGTIGMAKLVRDNRRFGISYSLCIIRPSKKIVPEYLEAIMNSYLVGKQADLGTKSIAVPDLGLREIKNFSIPLPPIEVQLQWKQKYDKMLGVVERQMQSTLEINELFNSLMQKAFRGEPQITQEQESKEHVNPESIKQTLLDYMK